MAQFPTLGNSFVRTNILVIGCLFAKKTKAALAVKCRILHVCFIAIALITSSSYAQVVLDEELELAYGDKSFVTIATGSKVQTARAPAVASVITAEDIHSLGARDLDEVLETVPGLHVSRSPSGYSPIYSIRGIRQSLVNSQVLMLLNGTPIKSVFAGDSGNVWGGLPLENVARIEIIRGPGSALYGADAFSGVVNVITKSSTDIDGIKVGFRGGSFNTSDGWLLHGGKWGSFDVTSYLRLGTTDGSDETIEQDAQSFYDTLFSSPTPSSLAPGSIKTGRDAIDGHLDLSKNKWRFWANYKLRDNVESGAGVAQALDESGVSSSKRVIADLTYHDPDFARNWDLTVNANYMYYNEKSDLVLYPPNSFFPPFTFVNGVIGNPYKWERNIRLGISAFYMGLEEHRIRIGAGYDVSDLYKIRESKNFTFGAGNLPVPLDGVNGTTIYDVSSSSPFIFPHKRTVKYLYVQDEWGFARDWTLTAGLRHDDYSDFGGTTNPRIALVWDAAYNTTAKLLYGEAFRAPSFSELYNINNPVLQGNPDLEPEEIKTLEAAVSWQAKKDLSLDFNIFRYEMEEIIRYVPNATGNISQNTGRQTGKGLEIEVTWDASRTVVLQGSYAYQDSIDKATGQDAGLAPNHQIYLRGDWRFSPGWSANAQINWVGKRKREPGDTRDDLGDYVLVDLTLRTNNRSGGWDYGFSIRNLFDEDAREPSPAPGLIPDDLPLPGRSFFAEAIYRFD